MIQRCMYTSLCNVLRTAGVACVYAHRALDRALILFVAHCSVLLTFDL